MLKGLREAGFRGGRPSPCSGDHLSVLKPPLSSTSHAEIDQFSLLKWVERSHKQTKLLFFFCIIQSFGAKVKRF